MEGLKRVKSFKKLKKGDRLLLVADPEVVEVTTYYSEPKRLRIDAELLYASDDSDLNDSTTGVKVYKLPKQ